MTKSPLFIGMPVYNGEKYLSDAIESIRKQDYLEWELLISDNCSSDNTARICEHFATIDTRIKYFKQKENIGAIGNFKFVLDKADSKYFMWAACDDIWHPNFVSSCLDLLEKNRKCCLAFTNIVNIDAYGRIIRNFPSFQRFTSRSPFRNIMTFLREPEIMGRANLIYGIYRLNALRNVWEEFSLSDDWGSDMVFVLTFFSRYKIAITPKVLFYKRIIRSEGDQPDRVRKIIVDLRQPLANPTIQQGNMLIKGEIKALKGTKFLGIALIILLHRLSKIYLQNLIVWKWRDKL